MVKNRRYEDDGGKGFGFRHIQCLLLFFGIAFAYALRINLSVGIVAMTDKSANPDFPEFDWDEKTKSVILSSFFWGYVLPQIPGGHLAQRFGAKYFLLSAVFICAVTTILTPWCAMVGGWKLMCALRGIQGFFQGVLFPSGHALISQWAPAGERATLVTMSYSGSQFGVVTMMATTGLIASSSLGWPGVFYISGSGGIIWSILWFIFGASKPSECKMISVEERLYIENSIGNEEDDSKKRIKTPWKDIWTSIPFYSLIFVHCCHIWGYWMLLTQIPTFMKGVLGLNIQSNALLSALPYLVMWITSFIFSALSNLITKKKLLSLALNRKLFNTFGLVLPAFALIGMGYVTKEQSNLAVLLLIAGVGLNSAVYLGYLVNHIDMAPNHGGTLMGITNGLSNIMAIIAPLAVGIIVDDEEDPAQWRIVFFLTAAVYILGNTVWLLFGKTSVQKWNSPNTEENKTSRRDSTLGDALESMN